MAVDEISFRVTVTSKELRNLGCWSWMMPQGDNNARTIIITKYFPTVIANAGGAHSQKIEAPANMKIQNDPRNQF